LLVRRKLIIPAISNLAFELIKNHLVVTNHHATGSVRASRQLWERVAQALVVLLLYLLAFLLLLAAFTPHHVVLVFPLGELAVASLGNSHLVMAAVLLFLPVGNKKKISLTLGSPVVQIIASVSVRSQSALTYFN
jgi:hypothetical protein